MSEADDLDRADMARLAAGHDAALNELMERHGERLFHFLIRALQDEDDAADLAQEVFVRVYQHRASFRPGARFSIWLYSIATNLVRDRFRHRARHPQVSLDAELGDDGKSLGSVLADRHPTPSEAAQADERAAAVRAAVAQLPEDLRTPLLLAEFEDRSQPEIGEILGCSAKAVEMRLYRARQRLREILGALASDG